MIVRMIDFRSDTVVQLEGIAGHCLEMGMSELEEHTVGYVKDVVG